MTDFSFLLNKGIEAALAASKIITSFYHNQHKLNIITKSNNTPVTFVDQNCEIKIREILKATNIPIIGEEQESENFQDRKKWEYCWVVDPLDGTREFLNKTGEFCVSIGLCHWGEPILGIIAAPELSFITFGGSAINKVKHFEGDYSSLSPEQVFEKAEDIKLVREKNDFTLLVSRSMFDENTAAMVNKLKAKNENLIIKHLGSAIKFVEIIKGGASAYYRPGPSFEWDTAGGHALVKHFGLSVNQIETQKELTYNKEDLKNPNFYCSVEPLPF